MAVDVFLKLTDVKGESTDSKHAGEIEIAGLNFKISNPTTIGSATGGAGAGKVHFNECHVQKKIDSSSPLLYQHCCAGKHFDNACVTFRKAGGTAMEYLKVTFRTVFISSYALNAQLTSADEEPYEQLEFVYGTLVVEYYPQDRLGKASPAVHGGWDQIMNKLA